jgi:hypothetical protein
MSITKSILNKKRFINIYKNNLNFNIYNRNYKLSKVIFVYINKSFFI